MPYKLYLSPDQHAWARRKGLEHGTTASAVVRLALDRLQMTEEQLGGDFLARKLTENQGELERASRIVRPALDRLKTEEQLGENKESGS